MRLITPELAKYKFPMLDLAPPEQVPKKPQPPEEPPPEPPEHTPRPQPNPFPQPGPGPDGPGGDGGAYFAGPYIEIAEANRQIRVSTSREDKPHVRFARSSLDQFVGVDFKAESENTEILSLEITEAQDTTFKLKFKAEQITYVKDIYLDEGAQKLYISRGKAYVFKPEDADPQTIETTPCTSDGDSGGGGSGGTYP